MFAMLSYPLFSIKNTVNIIMGHFVKLKFVTFNALNVVDRKILTFALYLLTAFVLIILRWWSSKPIGKQADRKEKQAESYVIVM